MRLLTPITLAALILAFTTANAQVRVNSYYRANGTYVQPSMRSSPDSTRLNNWSTQGNTNPYTGMAGTESPYPSAYRPYTAPSPRWTNPFGGTTRRNIYGY